MNFGGSDNRKKINDGTELQSKEFSDGSGLELYQTSFREYDPQIGRFHQVDPLAIVTENFSPYTYCLNNTLVNNDPLGLIGQDINDPGSHYITGWVRDPNGKVYFDPNAHDPGTTKPGDTYIGEEIRITDANGNPIGYGNDQGGISTNVTLQEVTVSGKKRSANNFPILQAGFFNGDVSPSDVINVGLVCLAMGYPSTGKYDS